MGNGDTVIDALPEDQRPRGGPYLRTIAATVPVPAGRRLWCINSRRWPVSLSDEVTDIYSRLERASTRVIQYPDGFQQADWRGYLPPPREQQLSGIIAASVSGRAVAIAAAEGRASREHRVFGVRRAPNENADLSPILDVNTFYQKEAAGGDPSCPHQFTHPPSPSGMYALYCRDRNGATMATATRKPPSPARRQHSHDARPPLRAAAAAG